MGEHGLSSSADDSPLDSQNRAAAHGSRRNSADLFSQVYKELRRLARARISAEKPGHTLQPTALVHEAYLRLMGDGPVEWANEAQFFAAAAEAMRRILVEHARSKGAIKRGGGQQRIPLSDVAELAESYPGTFLALHDALDELAAESHRAVEIVKFRYFAGLSVEQTAEAMSISPATVKRDWAFARAWLYRRLETAA